jgi:hypothetical protein
MFLLMFDMFCCLCTYSCFKSKFCEPLTETAGRRLVFASLILAVFCSGQAANLMAFIVLTFCMFCLCSMWQGLAQVKSINGVALQVFLTC